MFKYTCRLPLAFTAVGCLMDVSVNRITHVLRNEQEEGRKEEKVSTWYKLQPGKKLIHGFYLF